MTYADSIAPLLSKSCVPCHRPGKVAPFSLIGYENAKKWAPMLATVTKSRRMPPWKAKHGYGEFLDSRLLSAQEIDALERWNADGSPRGEPSHEPAVPVFDNDWPLGEPDLVLQPERTFQIEAEGKEVYRSFRLKHEFKKRTWVKAMAVDPGNDRVVHHLIAFLERSESSRMLESETTDGQIGFPTNSGGIGFIPDGVIGAWAPGSTVRMSAPGTAHLIEPGSSIVLQVHYTRTGKTEVDRTRIALYFADEPIQHEMKIEWIFDFDLQIPASDAAYKRTYIHDVDADLTLYGAMPHMHLLGQSMKADIEYPDGSVKPFIWVEDWDMNWQILYALKEPIRVPKGSKIRIEAIYDNSAGNPRNPNSPPRAVKFGEQTKNEMLLLMVPCTVHSDDATDP